MSEVSIPTTLSAEAITNVLQYYRTVALEVPVNFNMRTRMEEADLRYMREPVAGEADLELIVPIIAPQVATAVAYLAKLFLNTPEVFPMAAGKDADVIAEQYNVLLAKFADDWQWRRNLLLAFQDGYRYNLMAVEAAWTGKSVGALTNDIIPSTNALKTKKEVVSGFKIKHLDLYNTFWDMTVEPAMVSDDGDFAGYYEIMTTTRLHRFLQSLPHNSNFNHKLPEILASTAVEQNYYVPKINAKSTASSTNGRQTNWDTFLTGAANSNRLYSGMHEICTLYARVVPKDLGIIKNIPAPGTPQIWKFIIVNSRYVVYAERRTNAHDKLPIVFGQPREDSLGYQSKSLAEDLFDIQQLTSSMWSMELASTRRIIADRGIFNPDIIRADDINNPSPSAKIPTRNTAYNQPLSNAYYQIPYSDPGLGSRAGIASQLTQFSNAVSGANQVQQGQFIKGNKTNDQFDTVMANSDSRQVMGAVLLEDQFFTPIKALIKSDLLQYQEALTVYDKNTGQEVKVDPQVLRSTQANFVVTDGLMSVDKVMSTEAVGVALQSIAASPQLQAEYNLAPLFAHLMRLQGAKGLDKFVKTAEEKAQAQLVQTQGAQDGQQAPVSNTPQ